MTAHTHQNEKTLADWREAAAKEIAALEASDAVPKDPVLQHDYKAAVEDSRQVARQAWTRLLNFADVRVRAEIARHALWPAHHGDRRFEAVLGGKEFDDGLELNAFAERAVAELVRAALWMGEAAAAPGDRPRMPQLTDKQLDDLYAFAGDAETAGQCMRDTLSDVFHEYRLAAYDWDHARGLLSPEELEGASPEDRRRHEQARARARGQIASADPVQAPASTPIARAVQEIIVLDEVYNAADAAVTDRKRQRKVEACQGLLTDADIDAENTLARYKAIESAAFERGEIWKTLLLTLEPETLDDALSLLLVVTGAFGEVVDNHVSRVNGDDSVPDMPPEAKEIVKRIEDALNAVIRGMILHGGARSQLVDRFIGRDQLIPWHDGVKEARAAAAEVYARKEAEPTNT